MLAFTPESYSWNFEQTTALSRGLFWANFGFDTICAVLEMGFNVASLIWVHKTRHQIQSSVSTSENRKREIKLLLQSFILGCIYGATYLVFTIVFAFRLTPLTARLCLHGVWISNHSVNPLVYLAVNRRLRERVMRLLMWSKSWNRQYVQ
jgi:hypothetical protein